jgi:uncharacterized repeat protein (TIGR03803 family)
LHFWPNVVDSEHTAFKASSYFGVYFNSPAEAKIFCKGFLSPLQSKQGRSESMSIKMKRLLPGAAIYIAAAASPAFAQLYTLASFNGGDGSYPLAGVTLSGSTLYGTTQTGGSNGGLYGNGYGTVFSVPVAGGTPTVLASFNSSDGSYPVAGLIVSGNTLYGTTVHGGGGNDGGYGEVFSLPTSGGTPTVLAHFNVTDGEYPSTGLLLSGSTLYGTTINQIFSLPTSGGTPTVLASFNGPDGRRPNGLILSGSTLYGTTPSGGTGSGTVFSVPITGGTPTVLTSFNNTNGYGSYASLTLSGSTLYGTTKYGGGGAYAAGEVFSLPITGGTPDVLTSFQDNGTGGFFPSGNLVLSGNTLYGTTQNGGANGDGEVFSLPTSGGTPTVLISFNGTDGAGPAGGLILSGSTLYGTTAEGGVNGDGTVFELSSTLAAPEFNFTVDTVSEPTGSSPAVTDDAASLSNDEVGVTDDNLGHTTNAYLSLSTPNTTGEFKYTGITNGESIDVLLAFTGSPTSSTVDDIVTYINENAATGLTAYNILANLASYQEEFPIAFADNPNWDVLLQDTDVTGDPFVGYDFSQFNLDGYAAGSLDVADIDVVPEPDSLALLAVGGLGLMFKRSQRVKSKREI